MPVAEKFSALGAGTGFPNCLSAKNVVQDAEILKWTTLGGVNYLNYSSLSSSEIKQRIEISRINAMKLFWNIHKMNASSTNVNDSISDVSFSTEPKKRACLTNLLISNNGDTCLISMNIKIKRLYRGDTKDIENFIGFGFLENLNASNSAISSTVVTISSATSSVEIDDKKEIIKTGLSTFEGMPVVVKCRAKGSTSRGVDINQRSAVATNALIDGGVEKSTAKIDGLEFFDYA